MPSIAGFIHELISEDKFGSKFSDNIANRVKQLNVAQLHGLHAVLAKNAKDAKTDLWRNANQSIIDRIAAELQLKDNEHQQEVKILEDYRMQKRQKLERLRAAKEEEIRVKEMIEEKAHADALKEITNREFDRQTQERYSIMKRTFEAEEQRNKWWIRTAIAWVVLLAAVIVITAVILPMAIYITIGGVVVVTCGAAFAAYRAHLWTIILPIVIPREQIDAQVEQLEDTLIKQAHSQLQEKEKKFQEQQRKESKERKRLKKERKEKERLQIAMLEQQRLEKIAMAREVLQRERLAAAAAVEEAGQHSSTETMIEDIEGHDQEESVDGQDSINKDDRSLYSIDEDREEDEMDEVEASPRSAEQLQELVNELFVDADAEAAARALKSADEVELMRQQLPSNENAVDSLDIEDRLTNSTKRKPTAALSLQPTTGNQRNPHAVYIATADNSVDTIV